MFSFASGKIDFAHKLDKPSGPAEDYYKHLHPFYEILYFMKGECEYTVESETHTLHPGDLVLIKPGKYHFATVNRNADYERYVLKFGDEILPSFLHESLNACSAFVLNAKKYEISFRQLDSYFGNYTNDELQALYVCELVKLVVMLCKQPSPVPERSKTAVAKFIEYIDANICKPITLDTLNAEFNFSKSYISNEFKRYMKIPIMKYIKAKKIIAAHQRILNGEQISDVAQEFGFEDYSTFYRSYVKIIGYAPTETKRHAK